MSTTKAKTSPTATDRTFAKEMKTMTEVALTPDDLEALRRYDTPTICNALEVVAPERRSAGFTTETKVCEVPGLAPMVGFARTATIRSAVAPSRSPEQMRARRLEYYAYVADGRGPTVVAIRDLDAHPGLGAFWGEVNSHVHKGLGCLGTVTNGSIRDLDDLAAEFQMLAGKIAPSHAHVHVVDFGDPVEVLGMAVAHGDLIHADRHGAVVVPAAVARALPEAAELIGRREAVILAAAARADFGIEALRRAMGEAADIH